MTLIEQLRANYAHFHSLPEEVIIHLKEEMHRVSRKAKSIKYHGFTSGNEGRWENSDLWDSEMLITLAKTYFEAEGFTCKEEKDGDSRNGYHYLEISWE